MDSQLQQVKTVYFDLGNVIVFFSYPKMVDQIATCTGLTFDAVKSLLFDHKLRDLAETGKISSSDLYQRLKKESSRPFSFLELNEAFSDIFTPNEAIFPIITALKEKKIRLILLSNTSESHFNRVYSRYPILRLFDEMILSYQVGVAKPNPLIFKKALAKADCAPTHCFYTDDIPEYVSAARKTGLDAEVFTTAAALQGHLASRGCVLEEKK